MAQSEEMEASNVDKIAQKQEMEILKSDTDTLLALYEYIKVSSAVEYGQADEAASTLQTQKKNIIAFWAPIKARTWKNHQAVLAMEKAFFEPVDTRQKELNGEMAVWNREQQKKRDEILKKQREEQEAQRKKEEAALAKAKKTGTVQPAPKAFVPQPVETVEMAPKGSTGFRDIYQWELIDFEELPDRYKIQDTVKINKLVNAEKGKADIPGIRQWSEKVAVNRGK